MTIDHNIGPYFTLIKEAKKISDVIEKYSNWHSEFVVEYESYTVKEHLQYLTAKKLAYTNAMEILTQHGMGPK